MLSMKVQIDNAQEIGRFAADSLDDEEETGKLVEILKDLDNIREKTEQLRILVGSKNETDRK